ncbi:low temperature requirement protein A [Streptomyces sp. NPDC008121]|uniref:low temperature requirement protein A n=1 Tax=Streptomyces sp. NPDC008121 TaxID=3364809 RepID=UPI0036E6F7FB
MTELKTAPRDSTGAVQRDSRHAGWLELFFDLVFVALASQLAHTLHGDAGPADFAVFFALYFPPWWMWVNLTVAANLFQGDSPRHRVLILAAMLCLAVMAVAVPQAADGRAPAYALAYAGTRLVLLGLWWPATRRPAPGVPSVAAWRPLAYCLAPAAGWAGSAFIPGPWRWGIWALLLAAEVVVVLTVRGGRASRRLHTGHLVERTGLFVIIVLGEPVIAVVTSAGTRWTAAASWAALLGFVMLAALWWSYFDFGSAAAERVMGAASAAEAFRLARDVMGFLYFFVTAAVICVAAGLATVVEQAGQGRPEAAYWAVVALAGGLALYHTAHACIALRFGHRAGTVALWALPGVGVPLAVIALAGRLAPWQVVLVLAAETVLHLLYAQRRRTPAAAAG